MPGVSLREWKSKSTFREHFDERENGGLVVGESTESPRRFYSAVVELKGRMIEVGVVSSDLGSTPEAILLRNGSMLLIGYDEWVTWVDVAERKIANDLRINGVFFEFVAVNDEAVIVLHELGAIRVNASGAEVWSIDTDIVEAHRLDEVGNLILLVMDEDVPIVVSIESGKVCQ